MSANDLVANIVDSHIHRERRTTPARAAKKGRYGESREVHGKHIAPHLSSRDVSEIAASRQGCFCILSTLSTKTCRFG